MSASNENPTGNGRVPHYPPSRPGIRFVICAVGALGLLLAYAFTH